MMSELFDEQAMREQYDKALAKQYKEKYEAEGRAEGEAIGMIKSLVSLFKKGLLTLADASKEANMSEKEFEDLAASMS